MAHAWQGKLRALVLWLVLAVFVLGGICQLGLMGAGLWLDSPAGQSFVKARIDAPLAKNDYKLTAARINLIGTSAIDVPAFSLADAQGTFLSGKSLRLSFDLVELASGILPLSLQVDSLNLMRLPKGAPKAPKPPGVPFMTSFALPRLPIRQISLRALRIRQLTLGPAVAGMPLDLSPDLSAYVSLNGNVISLKLSGQLAAANASLPPWLPTEISMRGKLDTLQAMAKIDAFSLASSAYKITASGVTALGSAGQSDLHAQVMATDLQALAKNPGTGQLDLRLIGPADAPVADIDGVLHLATYAQKGLGDINLTLHADDLRNAPSGFLTMKTQYANRALQLTDKFSTAGTVIANEVTGVAPALSLAGQVSFDRRSKLANGVLKAKGDLSAYNDLIGVDMSGDAQADMTLTNAGDAQGVALDAKINRLAYKTTKIDSLAVTTSIKDIRLKMPQALSLTAGGISAPGVRVSQLSATLTQTTDGHYGAKVSVRGQTTVPFSLDGGATVAGASAATLSASDIDLMFRAGGGSLDVTGAVTPADINLALVLARLPLGILTASLPQGDAGILLSGKGSLAGPLAAPVGAADLSLTSRAIRQFALHLVATVQRGEASATVTGKGQGIKRLAGQASLPLQLSLKPFVAKVATAAPLSATLDADLDAGAALRGFLPPAVTLGGRIKAAMKGSGTLARPDFGGTFSLDDGSFRQQASGLMLRDIAMRGVLTRDQIKILSLRATDGKGGTLGANGAAGIGNGSPLDFKLNAANVDLFRSGGLARGLLSADLALQGRAGSYLLNGKVHGGPMNIDIPEQFNSNIPELNIIDPHKKSVAAPNALQGFRIDVAIHMPERIFVRGWGLNAEFGGDLHAGGTLAAPLVTGTLASRRGQFDQFGRSFSLDHANLRFDGAMPPSPYLDISASAPANDITATVALTGSVTSPAIALSSTPALPQDEVLSRLLFGASMSSITPFQAIQIAQTLNQLSGKGGGGGFDPLGKLRSATGLDDLTVGQSTTGATTVGAGKYLTNKVYIQVQAGADDKSSTANVQYELTKHLKLQSKVGADQQNGGGILWQWDY